MFAFGFFSGLPNPVKGAVFEGDSLFAGHGTTGGPVSSRYTALTGQSGISRAYPGDTLSGMDGSYAGDVAPSYNATTSNLLVQEGGTNDINGGATLAGLQTSIQSLATKAHATGFLFGACTITARGDGAWDGTKEGVRTSYNTWLVANWSSFAEYLFDIAALSQMSTPSSTAFFNADQLHWNDAGTDAVTTYILTTLGFAARTAATPTVAPTLPLDFTTGALPTNVVAFGGVGGSRVNASGNIVAASAPRFDYTTAGVSNGILVEPLSNNTLPPGDWQFFNSSFSAYTTGPDGGSGAFIINYGSGGASLYKNTYVAPGVYQIPAYVKVASGTQTFRLSWYDGVDHFSTDFTATTTWQRFNFPDTIPEGVVSFGISANSSNAAMTLHIWDAEVQLAPALTSYIPPITNSLRVGRSADVIKFVIPTGVTSITYTFDDASTQVASGLTPGSVYTVPTNLTRARIKTISAT